MNITEQLWALNSHQSINAYLDSIKAFMTVKISTGGGNSRKGTHRHPNGECEMLIVVSGTARMIVDDKTIILGKEKTQTDFLLTEDCEHGLFDKSDDFYCIIILLKSMSEK
jgi:hypothetical protein